MKIKVRRDADGKEYWLVQIAYNDHTRGDDYFTNERAFVIDPVTGCPGVFPLWSLTVIDENYIEQNKNEEG